MDNKIKTAISKAMAKLVGFSLNEKAMNGNSVEVALHGKHGHGVWVYWCINDVVDMEITSAPDSVEEINQFELKIEKLVAELTVKFHTPAEIMATLNTEVNE